MHGEVERAVMVGAGLVDELRAAPHIGIGEPEMVVEDGEPGLEIGDRRILLDARA
jgi:hypothetical protein